MPITIPGPTPGWRLAVKIVLTSDWHMNFNSQFDRTTSDGISKRLQEILDSVKWSAEIGIRHGAEMFLALGDLFERPDKLPTKEGLAILDCLTNVGALYKPKNVIALAGNHDMISSEHNIVSMFANSIRVVTKPTYLDAPGGRLFFVPYIREPETLYSVLNGLSESHDCIGRKYLFAHFWDTTVMGIDAEAIDLNAFNSRFFDRILLGHYHAPTKDFTNLAVYTGTLLNKKFSETGPKGCWILDTDTNSLAFFENPYSPEFYQTDDLTILRDPAIVDSSAYYRVLCDAENVVDINRILSKARGFELVSKKPDSGSDSAVSIDSIEKRNSLTLKDFIFKNADLYAPSDVPVDDFKCRGVELLSDL